MFLRKDILKIHSKFTGEHPCRSIISIKLLKQLYRNQRAYFPNRRIKDIRI